MTAPVVRLEDVSKIYGQGAAAVCALAGVSLEIRPGEMLGIVGPSGSGKTTLLTLAGLIDRPSAGLVQFANERPVSTETSVRELRAVRSRRIGFIFQKANLVPFLTATENVALGLAVLGVPGRGSLQRARLLLAGFGLGHRLDNYPSQLSGGEQQRVSLARALIGRPNLILADEPTASLDATRRQQVMELLRGLSEDSDISVCVVTHDMRALPMFDRVIELSDGRIVG